MTVVVIDYGMGNLASVRQSFQQCAADVRVSNTPAALADATHVVLPGVGAFAKGMEMLSAAGWLAPLSEAVLERKVPLLGICLGMQLLAEYGVEGGETAGLGLIAGRVSKLEAQTPQERIPHVGWNEIKIDRSTPLFVGVGSGSDFYFVHSYHFVPARTDVIATTTPYCGGFVSALMVQNICGVQFHPEKSSHLGRRVLQNFLAL